MLYRAVFSSVLAVLLLSLFPSSAPAEHLGPAAALGNYQLRKKIKRFQVVAPGIWRGGQPDEEALELLKASGVRTVINLRDQEGKVEDEEREARSLGLGFVNIPLSPHRSIPPAAVRKFLAIVTDPRMQPVFVHCKAGKDRTGAMFAIFRMAHQGWTVSRAYQEMHSIGFDEGYKNLQASVFAYAGRLGRSAPYPVAVD